jgi:hypothetical protein
LCLVWPGVLKTRAVPIQIPELDCYSEALSGPANNYQGGETDGQQLVPASS